MRFSRSGQGVSFTLMDTTTLRDLRRLMENCLKAAGIEQAALDARLLIQHALGVCRDELLTAGERVVSTDELAATMALIERRVAREPVSRIIGRREFWSLDLAISPDTLDPRPDSETLVEAVLDALDTARRETALRVLDLGTGSGCLLLALLSELPQATGIGLDISAGAVAVARRNAQHLHLHARGQFVTGDWSVGLDRLFQGLHFDIIVANPPYIAAHDLADLMPEVVAFDPLTALDGGEDGLDAYRALVPQLPSRLTQNGVVALEVGMGQAPDVSGLLVEAGFSTVTTVPDLAGIARCLRAHLG